MDIARIRREFADAQQTFALVELKPTPEGTVYARVALQTVATKQYVVSIRFPDSYPNEMPRVFVDATDHRHDAASVSGRCPLLSAPSHVESRGPQSHLRDRSRGEVVEQIRSVAQQRRHLARRRDQALRGAP